MNFDWAVALWQRLPFFNRPLDLNRAIDRAIADAREERCRDEKRRMRDNISEARRVIKEIPEQIKLRRLDEDSCLDLVNIREEELSSVAWYRASVGRLPSTADLLPGSRACLIAKTLEEEGRYVYIAAYRYEDVKIGPWTWKGEAEDEFHLRLVLDLGS